MDSFYQFLEGMKCYSIDDLTKLILLQEELKKPIDKRDLSIFNAFLANIDHTLLFKSKKFYRLDIEKYMGVSVFNKETDERGKIYPVKISSFSDDGYVFNGGVIFPNSSDLISEHKSSSELISSFSQILEFVYIKRLEDYFKGFEYELMESVGLSIPNYFLTSRGVKNLGEKDIGKRIMAEPGKFVKPEMLSEVVGIVHSNHIL